MDMLQKIYMFNAISDLEWHMFYHISIIWLASETSQYILTLLEFIEAE